MTNKPVLLSGIKPTGEIHIGNYFGAIKQLVDLLNTDEYQGYIFVADYHALNFVQNAEEMRRLTQELALTYIACGLDPEKIVLFKQSDVPAHTELAWIFDTITPMAYLMRAHAFTAAVDRSVSEIGIPDSVQFPAGRTGDELRQQFRRMLLEQTGGPNVNVGTFNYPMLMAADILLYDANIVPVGQDQKQHIEYARDTAEKFNRVFGETFTLPKEHIMPEVAVVPGTDGQKMSKSYGNTIPLFASREELRKKIMSIVTDSGETREEAVSRSLETREVVFREGISFATNVYNIHRLIKSQDELDPFYRENENNYKALKEALIEDLDAFIAPMRAKYEELSRNPEVVTEVLARGASKAREVAEAKMQLVRKHIGVSN